MMVEFFMFSMVVTGACLLQDLLPKSLVAKGERDLTMNQNHLHVANEHSHEVLFIESVKKIHETISNSLVS